jgi:hypothetical protein
LASEGDFIVVEATVRHTAVLGARASFNADRPANDELPLDADNSETAIGAAGPGAVDLPDPDASDPTDVDEDAVTDEQRAGSRRRHPAAQLAQPIEPDPDHDLPRPAWVRLDVVTLVGHRIDLIQLSSIALRDGES